ERELGAYRGDADWQVGGEAQQPQRPGPGRLVAFGAGGQLAQGGGRPGGAGAGAPQDRRGGEGGGVRQQVVQRAGGAGAFQPCRADLLLIQGDRYGGGRGSPRGGRLAAGGPAADGPSRPRGA